MEKKPFFALLLLVYCSLANAQSFKVIGYLPYYRFEKVQDIDFTALTHLNLAFVNPDTLGNLDIGGRDIDPIIDLARSENNAILIFASLAGGGMTDEWRKAYDKFLSPAYRSTFVHLLVKYLEIHGLDGLDVDLEWQDVNTYYSPFVLELADSLQAHGKQLSAALPATYRYPDLSDEALAAFDFINIMAYDATGPWQPDRPGPHSSFEFAKAGIAFWRNEGIADELIILGVPFYGWDFTDNNNVKAFTFGGLVADDANLAYRDRDGSRYYNGIITISEKTYYALNEVGGIMIWEVGQDAFGDDAEYSLLSAIDYVVTTGQLPVTALNNSPSKENAGWTVFPNPFQNEVNIEFHGNSGIFSYRIADLNGKVLTRGSTKFNEEMHTLDVSGLSSGVYLLSCRSGSKQYIQKIVKQ